MIGLLLAVSLATKGTICFSEKECVPTTGSTFEIKPGDVERRFVWTSGDGANVILGNAPAKAASIDLNAKEPATSSVTLTLHGDAARGWPADTRFAVAAGKDRVWRWTMPAKTIGKSIVIHVPQGSYQALILAEHYKAARVPMNAIKDSEPPALTLVPLPVITGRIVTVKEEKQSPVSGAQISRDDGKVVTSTNEQGVFRAELVEPVANEIVIAHPGFGTRLLPLKTLAAENDLGAIKLESGVKLTAKVTRPESLKSKTLPVELIAKSPDRYENTSIAKRELKPGESEIVFTDVAPGQYYVLLTGDGALEKLKTKVVVESHDASQEIRITPFELQGTVHFGADPVRDGKVDVTDEDHTWRADAPIDAEGRFGGTMWQAEGIGGWVASKDLGTLPIEDHPKLGTDPSTWDIAFKRRVISGRVFDEDTKEPIAGAGIHLQFQQAPDSKGRVGRQLYTNIKVDPEGKYFIVAMEEGVYDIAVSAPDHVDAKATIEVVENDQGHTLDFPMSRGVEQVIEFVSPGGEPLSGEVLEGVSRDGHNPAWYHGVDPSGRLTLRMIPGQQRTLFMVPREGSFVSLHVTAPDSAAKPIRVVVPPPVGSIVITMRNAENAAANGITQIRYNGEWIPFSVVSRLKNDWLGTGAYRINALPAGAYELWAYPSRRGFPPDAPPAREPVRVGLSAGEQTADLVLPN